MCGEINIETLPPDIAGIVNNEHFATLQFCGHFATNKLNGATQYDTEKNKGS